jgi:hypothetical protein
MRVICPHAGPIAPATTVALNATTWAWEGADVSESDTAYAGLLQQLWTAGQTFALVEHDIVIRPEVLDGLADCDRPWCAYAYQLRGQLHAGLGCVKFGADLLRAMPHAVSTTWAEQTLVHPAGHWCNLDDRLSRVLRRAGVAQHVHTPPVEHLAPTPSHGCS